MNAAEIEDEISKLADEPYDAQNFPYQFLRAFDVSEAAVAKLKSGRDNKSDVLNGVLQRARNNIHIATCAVGEVPATLEALKKSEATAKLKAKYVLATDGQAIAAERLRDGETLACDYKDLPNHFGILLDLAGISTTPRIDENTFDIRATSKLNKLYVELLRHNPDWGTDARRQDLNHFFARLIFCFFAEDTGIFDGARLFTSTVEQYTDRTGANVHEVLAELFRGMDVRREERAESDLRPFALKFPYVNGNLFGGNTDTPRFTQAARIYLLAVGSLDWKQVNPDIFGSMIQAVADDEERGALGMHYTSVPNILKVLNPLFLDDLNQKLVEAGDGSTPASKGQLKRLRDRLARIRVFDPACGSGNFLVIAYKQMRLIEAEINARRGERELPTVIPSTNFRGIEIRHFAAEIARLALIIAKFQCDALHIGELFARNQVLPLDKQNWITCGNALRLDWLQICPPTGTGVKIAGDDLFNTPLDQSEIDFENAGGETYICGNPPYQGSVNQTEDQKEDMKNVFHRYLPAYKDLDYVASWLVRASEYAELTTAAMAFVATNSVCQGEQVGMLWPILFRKNQRVFFAHTSFQWRNNATHNAGVTCIVLGLRNQANGRVFLYEEDSAREVGSIGPYLTPNSSTIVAKSARPLSGLPEMVSGNKATDGGHLILSKAELDDLAARSPAAMRFARRLEGAKEFIRGEIRWCLWITDDEAPTANAIPEIKRRIDEVYSVRSGSRGKQANEAAESPHRFVYAPHRKGTSILVPSVSSIRREYLPCGYFDDQTVIVAPNLALYGAPLWCLSLIASRMQLVWIGTVCGKLKTDFRYSNTLGWNTFPVPPLTDQNRADLNRCAEDILLGREAHFPATIAELYDPESMPADLRAAHERNDETVERIYIGRRFRNDTERLEKLFAMYTEMNGAGGEAAKRPRNPKK